MRLETLPDHSASSDPVKLAVNRVAVFAAKHPDMERGVFFAGDFNNFTILIRPRGGNPVARLICYGHIDCGRAMKQLEYLGLVEVELSGYRAAALYEIQHA